MLPTPLRPELLVPGLLQTIDQAALVFGPQGGLAAWNPAAETICENLGIEPLAVGQGLIALGQTCRLTGACRLLQAPAEGETTAERTCPNNPHKTVRWARLADGHLLGVFSDTTERHQIEAELQQANARTARLLDSVGEGVLGLDPEGRITFANQAAIELLGYESAELLGANGHERLHYKRPDGSPLPYDACPLHRVQEDPSYRFVGDQIYWRKDGSPLAVECIYTAIRESDVHLGTVVSFRDATERQNLEKTKDEFISVVSHELRTPLTSLFGALRLMERHADASETTSRDLLAIALRNANRLTHLINDILDLERITSPQMAFNMEACDGRTLLRHAAELLAVLANGAGVWLTIESSEGSAMADGDRILQALTNLLSNAIKFSEPGTQVSLGCRHEGDRVVFWVRDQGRGIPLDKLETIFGRFQQVDATDSRKKGGTGLGLAISRSIIEGHGGTLGVESELGVGSTFSFDLPRA